MVVVLFVIGALALLMGVALVINALVRRRSVAPPEPRTDGLADDLLLGIGLNLYP